MSLKKSNVMRLLDAAGVEYEVFEYDGENGRIDGVEIAKRIGKPPEAVCKTLVTTTDHRTYFVFVIPVNSTLDLKRAAKTAGVKALAMLPAARLFQLTGYLHGGCSPLGIKTAMKIYIDAAVENLPVIYVSGGRIGLNVGVNPKILASLANAHFMP